MMSGTLDIAGARSNCFKETSGTKMGRRTVPPPSDKQDSRNFPQRRHNETSFAQSPGLIAPFDHIERRHLRPAERPITPPGMPPLLRKMGAAFVTTMVGARQKFPGVDANRGGIIQLGGKKTDMVAAKDSLTSEGLGHLPFVAAPVGAVAKTVLEDGNLAQCKRGREVQLHEVMMQRRKADHNLNRAHVSFETPVNFPAWPGYPPSCDKTGHSIDYALKASGNGGGDLNRRKLCKARLEPRVGTPGMVAQRAHTSVASDRVAGQTSFAFKCQMPQYQSEIRHMIPSEHKAEVHGCYRPARTRPQQLAFGLAER